MIGDKVLFVPVMAKWPVRCYMVGTVCSVTGKFATVVDVTGVLHTVYLASVVTVSSPTVSIAPFCLH